MRVLYGTGNQAKLSAMQRRLSSLDIEIIGLKDLEADIPEVPEDGKTPLENARQKAYAYFDAFHIPVFSCDSGLYFDNVPDAVQPGVHVRTVNGKYLTDEEMIAYYTGMAQKYGDLTSRYKNAICFNAAFNTASTSASAAGSAFATADIASAGEYPSASKACAASSLTVLVSAAGTLLSSVFS